MWVLTEAYVIMYRFSILCILLTSSVALPTETMESIIEKPTVQKADCSKGVFNPTCLKIEVISLVESLNGREELHILPGISVVREKKDNQSSKTDFSKYIGAKPDEKIDKYLLYSIGNYLDTHSVKLRLLSDNVTEEARALIGEARSKGIGGKKGGLGPLLALAAMMKATLMSVAMGALALLAGKALLAALMSLLLSAVIGIKSLSSGQKSTTYEVIAKPIITHSHSSTHEDAGYGHAYGRSLKIRRRRSAASPYYDSY